MALQKAQIWQSIKSLPIPLFNLISSLPSEMRLSLLLFSALALAAPVSTESEYSQLLSLVENSHESGLAKRSDYNTTIVMFSEDASIADKLSHVKSLLAHDSHIRKLYDVGQLDSGAGVVGYVGRFSPEALELIAASEAIDVHEQDSAVSGLASTVGEVTTHRDVVKRDGLFSSSTNSLFWHLGRISHRENPKGTDQEYTYVYRHDNRFPSNIYVVDSGIRTTHQVFGGRAKWGTNFVNNVNTDEHGHGTGVAGLAAQIAVNADVWAVKVLGADNAGKLSDVVSGLEWALTHSAGQKGKSVVNVSMGSSLTKLYDPLIKRANDMGVALFFAAGNTDTDACNNSPAEAAKRFPGVYTVTSTDPSDRQSTWAAWGSCVNMQAPADLIVAPYNTGDDAYVGWVGTSMASPQVAGIAAYWMSILPFDLASLEWVLTQNTGKIQTRHDTKNVLAWNFHI